MARLPSALALVLLLVVVIGSVLSSRQPAGAGTGRVVVGEPPSAAAVADIEVGGLKRRLGRQVVLGSRLRFVLPGGVDLVEVARFDEQGMQPACGGGHGRPASTKAST